MGLWYGKCSSMILGLIVGWNCLKLIATFKEDKGVWAQKIDLILEQPMDYRPSPFG